MIRNPIENTHNCPVNGVCPYVEKLKKCMEQYRVQLAKQNDPKNRNRGKDTGNIKIDSKSPCAELLKYVQQTVKEEITRATKNLQQQQKRKRKGRSKFGSDTDTTAKADVWSITSRELRAGILYVGCDCGKWNGLQDQCPRRGCQGSPACLTNPPTCGPSRFSNAKHLERKVRRRIEKRRRL